MMRRILVDYARARNVAKRGGAWHKLDFEHALALPQDQDRNLIAFDEALESLAAIDAEKSKIVELKFFGGLTIEETAEVLNLSLNRVKAQWKMAKTWLYREIRRT
jgi:RNA polymerase sigma factor (TIGR02999 family)